eukprot:CAMPEP_0172153482 /NCGR_PEP_ID=MMETSP1050-20130122/1470_1 /TAXON_ID=233186 /ORGANISM="Cryptomonas curvata, Strain CCAP979/52" /LENGTH=58 /DNA_ID=CAMNT_0012822025 /DNA_START=149 /DNA_END=325 /DNA_ORIENTATION=+
MFALLWHYKQQAQPHADLRDSQRFEILYATDSGSASNAQGGEWFSSADLRDVNTIELL